MDKIDISKMQSEIGEWIVENFGPEDPVVAGLVLAEETGELARAVAKMTQGIRGTKLDWLNQASLEIGDVMISLLSVAHALGIEAEEAIEGRWRFIQQRDWNTDRIQHGITQ